MRNATILVLRLKGVATEAIKNIVLAGIGKLVVVDAEDVSEEDLGAGFFFRDEDVGQKVRLRGQAFCLCSISLHMLPTNDLRAEPCFPVTLNCPLSSIARGVAHAV